ncbi:substrate-binding domain-containing protein [Bifidobacterium sp. MA2]|uniref:Substrate-binding domain-containing protein n=1 Tax=Bifidobacterium santillanense TaxID=2809028 RepID=A0ABS5UPE1_9BIFI|nr:substrate-binding domain-containing protein [Bifidobacterium santillanense]MBT1172675.1 substrate-binding domain-containing protein [Bifidobacterium santillanense]
MSKSKIIGLIALLAIVAILAGTLVWRQIGPKPAAPVQPVETVNVNGYLGGEKIGLFDDPVFLKAAAAQGLDVNYRKAGSLAMMTADTKGMDYLFPSSRAAVEYGAAQGVKATQSDIVFNSPIVLYTHKVVADGLVAGGIMSKGKDGVYSMDMAKAVDAMLANKTWADVGYAAGYGQFRIDSTDPVQSNSGNEYAALIATVLNGGQPATTDSLARDGDKIRTIFAKSGWMETSSEDAFNQFLTLGVGSKPMMVGYESQILDLAVNQPSAFKQIKDDVVIVYPTPTVWSTHTLMALDKKGEKLLSVLKSSEIQKLAWTRHGFRAANFSGTDSIKRFKVGGTLEQVTAVSELPRNNAMQALIELLKGLTPQPQ